MPNANLKGESPSTQAQYPRGPWKWRSFDGGQRYSLFTAHSGAKVVIGGNPDAQIVARNKSGILEPITPDHPVAELIAQAPTLLAERDELREINRELVEALETILPAFEHLYRNQCDVFDQIDREASFSLQHGCGKAKAALRRSGVSK